MYHRIIPRLDIKGPNLVKGARFPGLRVLGRPERHARHYYENGADEHFYQDAVASLYGRNCLTEIIAKTAREIFIPLTVGGGLPSLDDIKEVLGAEAVSLASLLHYRHLEDYRLEQQAFAGEGNTDIPEVKEHLRQRGLACRPAPMGASHA